MARERVKVEYRFIIPMGGGMYLMESEERPVNVWHSVDLNDGCSCENAQASHNPNCKHKRRLQAYKEAGRLPDPQYGKAEFQVS